MELIKSEYTRKRYEEIGFRLLDSDKATLIWNDYAMSVNEKIKALSNLKETTEDKELRQQIGERMDYESKIDKCFRNNEARKFVYVVKADMDGVCWGYFFLFDTAFKQAQKVVREEKMEVTIEKQLIVAGDEIPKVVQGMRVNPNLCQEQPETLVDYSGEAIAVMNMDVKGEIDSLWSNELPEEYTVVDSYNKERFEFKFIKVPYVHKKGATVKNVVTEESGILETGKEDWDEFLRKVDAGLYVDYVDVSHTVMYLTDEGEWTHDHWSPFVMEILSTNDNEKQDIGG